MARESMKDLGVKGACVLCGSGEVLSDSVKDSERLAGWLGIDFYGDICLACWDVEKARR